MEREEIQTKEQKRTLPASEQEAIRIILTLQKLNFLPNEPWTKIEMSEITQTDRRSSLRRFVEISCSSYTAKIFLSRFGLRTEDDSPRSGSAAWKAEGLRLIIVRGQLNFKNGPCREVRTFSIVDTQSIEYLLSLNA